VRFWTRLPRNNPGRAVPGFLVPVFGCHALICRDCGTVLEMVDGVKGKRAVWFVWSDGNVRVVVYPSGLPYDGAVMKRRKAGRDRQRLYIKNPMAHRLAEVIRKATGVTLSDAVIGAPEEKVRKTGQPLNRAKLDRLCDRMAALPVLDPRPAEQILDYDDFGLPC
jgi:antitoxin VapB